MGRKNSYPQIYFDMLGLCLFRDSTLARCLRKMDSGNTNYPLPTAIGARAAETASDAVRGLR